jgi:hypothetical protein
MLKFRDNEEKSRVKFPTFENIPWSSGCLESLPNHPKKSSSEFEEAVGLQNIHTLQNLIKQMTTE